MKQILLAAILFLTACSSPVGSDNPTTFDKNACVTAGAAYVMAYTELNGNCGPLQAETVIIPADGKIELPATCSGDAPRYDGCDVYYGNSCVGPYGDGSKNATVTTVGKMSWATDGSGGAGVETISVTVSGLTPCRGTYRVEATRL